MRTDTPPVALPSEERSETTVSEDLASTRDDGGVFIVLDVTKVPPKPRAKKEGETEKEKAELQAEEEAQEGTLKLDVEFKDELSGKWIPVTAFAASKKASEIEAGETLAFTLAAGAAETAAINNHEVQALPVPRIWRVKVEHSKAGKWTYSVGYQVVSA